MKGPLGPLLVCVSAVYLCAEGVGRGMCGRGGGCGGCICVWKGWGEGGGVTGQMLIGVNHGVNHHPLTINNYMVSLIEGASLSTF
jgi:hypothetical protein